MCKISYEKCICYILLFVILVVLICSGSPIDKVAMHSTNSSKKFIRTRSVDFLSRIFNKSTESHRLRHVRPARAETRTPKKPMGHIEALVIQNDANTSEHFVQVPSSLTKAINTRSQRSFQNSRRRSKQDCQPENFSVKAYKSQIVLRAKVQGIERTNYTVSFRVIEQLKNSSSFPIHGYVTLQFSNRTRNCDQRRRGKKNLVKADIKKAAEEYILFLDDSGLPTYSPERIDNTKRKRYKKQKDYMLKILKKVCRPGFKPKPPTIVTLKDKSSWFQHHKPSRKKLRLMCRVRGLPIPRISWRHANITLVNSTQVRISYVKRWSMLEIREPRDDEYGRYECVATGVNGSTASKTAFVNPFIENTRKCNQTESEFCMGNGICYKDDVNEYFCECNDGYSGLRCEQKTAYLPSRYPQTPSYACRLGLSTKYYCS